MLTCRNLQCLPLSNGRRPYEADWMSSAGVFEQMRGVLLLSHPGLVGKETWGEVTAGRHWLEPTIKEGRAFLCQSLQS